MADFLAPYHPLEAHYDATRDPPGEQYLLGTDHLGRDVLSRLIYGAQVTLVVAVSSVVIGETLGFAWGVVSGYMGRRVDLVSQRLLEVLMAFPTLILALLLMSGLGAGLHTVVIAIAVTRIPGSARIIRSVVLSVKEMAYVEAVRCLGASTPRIMLRHVAPQCIAPMLVVASLNLGIAIFAEAALSFLGVGIPPPTPSWGNMLGGRAGRSVPAALVDRPVPGAGDHGDDPGLQPARGRPPRLPGPTAAPTSDVNRVRLHGCHGTSPASRRARLMRPSPR